MSIKDNYDLFLEEHEEEWRRQAIDDREALMREDYLANVDCMTCIYRSRRGECVNLTSAYFGEEVSYDVCDEYESNEED